MRRIKVLLLGILFSSSAFSGTDIKDVKVINVYQLDSDPTVFEFRASVDNSCGGVYWRVKSPNEAVANRKFSIVLTAYTTKNSFSFHSEQECEANREVVSWVRLEANGT